MVLAATAASSANGPQKLPAEAADVPANNTLPRAMQVHYVLKLLALKGEASAAEIRKRMKDKRGVTVKGLHFDPSVLADALEQWSAARFSKTISDEPQAEPPPERPPPRSPKTLKRHGSSGSAATPPTPSRKRSFSSAVDENMDPQAMSAIGRAAKEKAGRRAGSGAPAAKPPPPAKAAAPHQSPGAGPRPHKRLRPTAAPAAEPTAWEPPTTFPPSGAGKSVKELKLLLAECGLDCSGCVEKADLQALWDRFDFFRGRPLEELCSACAASGGPHTASAEDCARYLAAPPKAGGGGGGQGPTAPSAPAAAAPAPAPAAEPAADDAGAEAAIRERDAEKEVQRIQALRKERFPTAVAWGFAVLDVTARDVTAVQRGYRTMMRKLHPDKVGRSAEVTRAVELIREAKELCERGLSKQEPPGAPRCLKSSTLCGVHGKRKFRLQWLAPEDRPSAPVRRYVVAAVDPAYGRALTITVLEPDYSEEMHRFVGVEELTSYVFAEEELQKMPRLWQQAYASVQVAAANESGQSPWATLQLPLVGGGALPQPDWASVPRSGLSAGPPSTWAPPSSARGEAADDPDVFDRELRRRHGSELHVWLEKQRKASLASWLRSTGWPSLGSKEELVMRIVQAAGRKTTGRRGAGKL
mmetsp:Transcript_12034/g.36304  ORF Transcript_12034/g.36304 Transcript_12034/m.36304 type:complete len:642 (+) Transcript_12034:184-2109(+)